DVPVLVVDDPVPLLGLAPEVPLLLDPVCATAMPAPTARDTAAAMARSRGCVLMMSVPVQVQRSDRRPAGLPATAHRRSRARHEFQRRRRRQCTCPIDGFAA